jgi:ribosomal protein S18 acetylase RimI-like enzyme
MKEMIRKATLEDLEACTLLFDKYMLFYNQPSNLEKHRSFLQERIRRNEAAVFLAFENEKPVGFTLVYPTFSSVRLSKILILNDLYVEKEERKNGIGEKLIQKVIELAQLSNADLVRLRTANDNYTAQGLYEKLNFKKDEKFLTYDLSLN